MKKLSNLNHILYFLGIYIASLTLFSCTEERITCEGNDDCPEGFQCYEGYCLDRNEYACLDIECREYEVCYKGSCFESYSCEFPCPEGMICPLGGDECEADPCYGVRCSEGDVCIEGECIEYLSCDYFGCPTGSLCIMGECSEIKFEYNPCARVTCQEGEVCFEGICFNIDFEQRPDEADNCYPVTCPKGWVCDDGQCLPMDPHWHESMVISDPWFILEGIALDEMGIPLNGVNIFVQDRLTPFTTNDEGQFSLLIKDNQTVRLIQSGQNDMLFKANPDIKNVLLQFKK